MPTIRTTEIAIVVVAVLLLYVAPFLLMQLEAFRRRQDQPSAGPATSVEPAAIGGNASAAYETQRNGLTPAAGETATAPEPAAPAPPLSPLPAVAAEIGDATGFLPVAEADQEGFAAGSGEGFPLDLPFPKGDDSDIRAAHVPPTTAEQDAPGATEPCLLPEVSVHVAVPSTDAPVVAAPSIGFTGYAPPAATAFPRRDGYRFRLEDLHRARLADWPPEQVQSDPARRQLWSEAERLATACDAVLSATNLVAPCLVRSACLSACERGAAGMALHFLLFPDLWPAGPQQAVARVVFEIDPAGHLIGHAVDALASS